MFSGEAPAAHSADQGASSTHAPLRYLKGTPKFVYLQKADIPPRSCTQSSSDPNDRTRPINCVSVSNSLARDARQAP